MDINGLGSTAILADYRQTNQRLSATLERISTGERAPSAKTDPILWGDVQQLKEHAATLTGISDNLNRGASSVRVAMDSMEASRQHLLQLEQELTAAHASKPGSVERAMHLRSYNQLHRFVDDVAKAPDEGARRLLDSPRRFPDAGSVEIRAGEDGYSLAIRSREIHTGASGLNLPKAGEATPAELEIDPLASPVINDINNASNREIEEMVIYLEAAKADLTAKTKALTVDASAIESTLELNEALITRNTFRADALNAPDLNTEAVLANSLTLKNSLALSGLAGLKETHRMALQLLQ